MEIILEQCTLREWRPSDEASLVKHANNKNVSRNLSDIFPYPYTAEAARAWLGKHEGVQPQRDFAIVIDGDAVGGVGLYPGKDIFHRSAEIGYWLGEEYWGRGIVTEAVRAVTKYGFEAFNLMHIFAGCFERNTGSRRVLEKAGFELEGRLRMHATKDGVTMNDVVYGIVRPGVSVPD
ncbi:MAG TPA: GNAT family N-acetyltransferase [Candidatus Eremiobacteraceae bacterium]|nr:GNAT family N-acetyltransferase [Candidatus Eremiobacteraceae bacterium]